MGYLSGALAILGFIPYILAIFRGMKPQKSTWLIWAVLDTIILAGMVAVKTVNAQIVGAVIGVWVIVALTFRYGTPGWSRTDKLCLAGAALGIALMPVSPLMSVVASSTVVFLGSTPTFMEEWRKPGSEDRTAWLIFLASCIASLIAIPQWTLGDATQPITFFAVTAIMILIMLIRPAISTHTSRGVS